MYTSRLTDLGTHSMCGSAVVAVVDADGTSRFSDAQPAALCALGEMDRVEERFFPPKYAYVRTLMALAPAHADKFPLLYRLPGGQRAEIYPRLVRYHGRLFPRHVPHSGADEGGDMLRVVKRDGRVFIVDTLRIAYAQPTLFQTVLMRDVVSGELCEVDRAHLTSVKCASSRENRPGLVTVFAYYNCTFEAHDSYLELRALHVPLEKVLFIDVCNSSPPRRVRSTRPDHAPAHGARRPERALSGRPPGALARQRLWPGRRLSRARHR